MLDHPPLTPHQASPRRNERAQAMVEFAIVLPILALVLFAVVQFGMAFWTYQQVSAAASEGARRAAVSRSSTTRDSDVREAARNASPNLTASAMLVDSDSLWLAGGPVTVTVSYPLQVRIMGITFFDDRVSVVRTARVEQ